MASTRSISWIGTALRRYGSVQRFAGRETATRRPIATNSQLAPHILSSTYSNVHLQRASISSTPPRHIIGWAQEKLQERAQNQKSVKIVDQINLMANAEKWTAKMFLDEIDETLSSWATKVFGSNTLEIQKAKESQLIVKGMMEVCGDDVTAADISKWDKKTKLKVAIACKRPMDECEMVLGSFQQMDIMHRILRYRVKEGLELPVDEAGLKMAMQTDGQKVMTKAEKKEMRDLYAKQHAMGN